MPSYETVKQNLFILSWLSDFVALSVFIFGVRGLYLRFIMQWEVKIMSNYEYVSSLNHINTFFKILINIE